MNNNRLILFSLMSFLLILVFFPFSAKADTAPDYLWHFNECTGSISQEAHGLNPMNISNNVWSPGKWNCGLEQYYSRQSASTTFNESIDTNNITISFYSKFPTNSSREDIGVRS